MFAVAILERDSGRVFCARDRLGIKPFYYAETPGALRFASTLPALAGTDGVNRDIDPIALHHYLTFHAVVPAPHTILAGVRKLPPAKKSGRVARTPSTETWRRWSRWTAPHRRRVKTHTSVPRR
jgi:asparagine synthase (glutamine-hydrolysing)